ncbi:hypothetical protein J6590_085163 [Homalodisca vitripennis]|nr:hypothetical protein J6590_085163 [Homalodisca vitripennis]
MLNNPEPGFIQMTCIGVLCDFELTPKVVKFERVLLYRKECSLLNLINRSYKPLGWRLVGVPLLSEQVSVSQQSGVIQALQTANVYVNFHAQFVEVATHSIQIEVFDDEFRGEPFMTESLEIVLESVDVLVDIIFPSEKYSEINFDTVQVGEPETQTIILKNKGKYDVTFQPDRRDPSGGTRGARQWRDTGSGAGGVRQRRSTVASHQCHYLLG